MCHAITQACNWILEQGYRNVVIEINNECDTNYEHEILQPERVHEAIALAQKITHNGHRLLIGTSYVGGGQIPSEAVTETSDFLLIHGNMISEPLVIANMVERALATYTPKPILFNEDDHFNFD